MFQISDTYHGYLNRGLTVSKSLSLNEIFQVIQVTPDEGIGAKGIALKVQELLEDVNPLVNVSTQLITTLIGKMLLSITLKLLRRRKFSGTSMTYLKGIF